MSISLFAGLINWYTLYSVLPSLEDSPRVQLAHLNWVAALPSLIFISSLTGIMYPGAGWTDPEFGESREQLYMFPVIVGLAWVGWYIERRRLLGLIQKKGN